jgi:hypothetical protein
VSALVFFQQKQGKKAEAIGVLKKAAENPALPERARREFRMQARGLEAE